MENLKGKIEEFAVSKGADHVGIASVSRFSGAPDGHKPTDILPDAKAAIACAKRFPNSLVVEGPATSYHHMMAILDNRLDLITNEMRAHEERTGLVCKIKRKA